VKSINGLVQCKMLLFCTKTTMKESHNFELSHLEGEEEGEGGREEEEEEILSIQILSI